MQRRMKRLVRCRILEKPGIGTIHMHTRWWSARVCEVFYIPEGRRKMHNVPLHRLWEFFDVESPEQAMAIIRNP